jgi:hypothetical protein
MKTIEFSGFYNFTSPREMAGVMTRAYGADS